MEKMALNDKMELEAQTISVSSALQIAGIITNLFVRVSDADTSFKRKI